MAGKHGKQQAWCLEQEAEGLHLDLPVHSRESELTKLASSDTLLPVRLYLLHLPNQCHQLETKTLKCLRLSGAFLQTATMSIYLFAFLLLIHTQECPFESMFLALSP